MSKSLTFSPNAAHGSDGVLPHHATITVYIFLSICRSSSFKEDDGTWKGNDDGKVVNNQPQRVMDDRNGTMPQGGYIGR